MKLYIQNMVSLRCKLTVKSELEKLRLKHYHVELGEVEIKQALPPEKLNKFKIALHKTGLELIEDQRAIIVEKIKTLIIELIHYSDEIPKVKYSEYISEKLKSDYPHLARMFSEVKGITIEHFIILHKIERIKELIIYDELNLSEIADMLHYSSPAHLTSQFKKVTGLTPSFFKTLKHKRRIPIENL